MSDLNNKPWILETERTWLTPFQSNEATLFHSINITPHVRQFLWDDEIISLDTAGEIMETNRNHFEQYGFGLWKIVAKEVNIILGYVGLWSFFNEPQPQLVYIISKDYAGKGYATECASQIINYVFDELGFTYLIASSDEPHLESQRVAQKLGMRLVEKKIVEGKPTVFYRIDREI